MRYYGFKTAQHSTNQCLVTTAANGSCTKQLFDRCMQAVVLILAIAGCSINMSENPKVLMKTSLGELEIELFQEEAPVTVENFLQYVGDGFYDGLIFHRVVPNFVIQGGGFQTGMAKKSARSPIINEAENGLLNLRGTLSMARTSDPNSASSQFFVNLKHNEFLDYQSNPPGYAVFAKVTHGMEVVDAIAAVKTADQKGFKNVPEKDVIIESVVVLSP